MESEDEDLRAAIAASLADAPPPERAINHETSVVDLTADSDDDVIPIFPKSKSVVGSDTSRDASILENAEDDEDLKLAIALSLQSPVGQGDSSTSEPNSIPPPERKEKEKTEPKATGNAFLGLDRKKMEEERLARLAKRKAQSPAAEQRELKQPCTRSQPDASSVHTDTAMQPVAPTSVSGVQFSVGTVKKTFASGHRRLGDDIKIEEVLQSSDLELGVLSSFMWDIDWLFSKVNMEKSRLLLIMQAKDEATKRQYESETASIKSLRLCFPPMEGQINCMHSKLMLLFHPTYLRIAVPTANLTPFDWGEDGVMENSVFLIDLPKKDGSMSGCSTSFYKDLVYFLKASTLHENIIRKLEDFDFSKTSQFAFVHTIGGSHWGDSWKETGYCGLGRSLSSLGLQANKPINLDFVTSSLGSITPDFMRCIYLAAQGDSGLTELSFRTAKTFPAKSLADPRRLLPASIADEWKERVRVYFPSEDTVLQSRGGPNSAGTICFQERWFENGKFPKNVLRDCVSVREGLVMHNKILYVQPDEPICLQGKQQCLGWAYVGSANLSESAWGRLVYDRTRKEPKLNCRNWECGVVIPVVEGKNKNDLDASTGNTEETKSQAGGQPGKSRGAQGKGKEENGCLLDVFRALDRILEKATDPTSGILHGTVFIAVDRSGETIYARTSGVDSVATGAEASPKPLQLNSLYWVASMTKLVTAVAAVQLIERKILDLDMDVRKYVKELEGVRVLRRVEKDSLGQGNSFFDPVEGQITLRHLLTHTSGLVNDSSSPLLQQWSRSQGRTAHTFCGGSGADGAEQEGYTHPLLFQPGTSWGYGAGLDWAGVLIERVTGVRLSTYIEDNIFSRLDASCTSFLHPDQQPQDKTPPPLLGMAYRTTPKPRNRNSKATNSSFTTPSPVLKPMPSLQAGPIILKYPLSHDLGGIGLFSTPADFASLLASLLRDGDRIFSRGKDSTDLLFAPQLFSEYPKAGKALPAGLGRQMKRVFGVGVNARSSTVKQPVEQQEVDIEIDHSLAGLVAMHDIPGRRAKGSVGWAGLPNCHWWIDCESGIAAALFTQLMPPSDEKVTGLLISLEEALYAAVGNKEM